MTTVLLNLIIVAALFSSVYCGRQQQPVTNEPKSGSYSLVLRSCSDTYAEYSGNLALPTYLPNNAQGWTEIFINGSRYCYLDTEFKYKKLFGKADSCASKKNADKGSYAMMEEISVGDRVTAKGRCTHTWQVNLPIY